MEAVSTAQERYAQLETTREPYLRRARRCAEFTIPTLFPAASATGSTSFATPWQSVGARGVANLGAKLLMALYPPNQPFFRLMIDDAALAQLGGSEAIRGQIETGLGQIERIVQTEIETSNLRATLFEALKQLLVAGNVLLEGLGEGRWRSIRLDHYVVKRSPSGDVIEVIIKEAVSPAVLPLQVREAIASAAKAPSNSSNPDTTIDLFTRLKRHGDMMEVSQEVAGVVLPGSQGEFPVDRCPFLPLRWAKVDGEDYGRGHVEEYLGDLISLDGLTQAIVEGSAAAAKVLLLVRPNGTTEERTIATAKNGDVVSGDVNDVGVLQLDKYNDFRVAQETVQMISGRLAQAFLLNMSVTRQAERVTAEEIRLLAKELEDALGGTYSILTQELQLPLVNILMGDLERQGKTPQLPKGQVRPAIITGLDALGRGHDLQRLTMFGQLVQQTLGPEVFSTYINPTEYLTRIAAYVGLSLKGLVKGPEEIAQDRANAQRQRMLETLGPEVLRAAQADQQQNGAP